MLTVVIPVYNREHTLQSTLASVDAQTCRPERVIIVDNASTDSSLSIVTDWAASRPYVTVLSEPKPGACAARNRGLREVTTEWTMFFDSDDIMHPHHVADFVDAIGSHPDADILGRDVEIVFPDGRRRKGYFSVHPDVMFWHFFRSSLATQRYVARTDLYRRVGGWDETVMGWNDLELGVRLLMSSPKVYKIGGEISVSALFQEKSITGILKSDHPERWEHAMFTIRRHFAALPEAHPSRALWLSWTDVRLIVLAAKYKREAALTDDSAEKSRRMALADNLYDRVIAITSHPRVIAIFFRYYSRVGRLVWPLATLLRPFLT